MASNNWKGIAIGIAVVAGILLLMLALEKKKNKYLENKIDEQKTIDAEIKEKLKTLIANNKEIDPAIVKELSNIVALIEISQEPKAIATLAKIIENLLKELYKGDKELKEKVNKENRKQPTFDDYLEHAKDKGVVSKEDYHLLSVMKIIRNKEAHELDVKKEKSRILAALIAGIGIILFLCRLLKEKKSAKIIKDTVSAVPTS